jgi:hypothetical protein
VRFGYRRPRFDFEGNCCLDLGAWRVHFWGGMKTVRQIIILSIGLILMGCGCASKPPVADDKSYLLEYGKYQQNLQNEDEERKLESEYPQWILLRWLAEGLGDNPSTNSIVNPK